MKYKTFRAGLIGWAALLAISTQADTIRLDQLDIQNTRQDNSQPRADKSAGGKALKIGETSYDHGLGTFASSILDITVNGATRFSANVGVDAAITNQRAAMEFLVLADGKVLWQSGVMKAKEAPKSVSVALRGCKTLTLKVSVAGEPGNYDYADWANAQFEYAGTPPATLPPPSEPAVIRTPADSPLPRIHGPSVAGARPGHPFFYHVPVTGEGTITLTAKDLPRGLQLDPVNWNITGIVANAGEYKVKIAAKSAQGRDEKVLKIKIGDQIALTPPLGWNSWNCFAQAVDDGKIRSAADAMVRSGLINHGWTYINIDDCWEAGRDTNGFIQSNEKFPSMKALSDYIHSKGLKMGIYSSPGPKTCGGYEGSWQHEEQDAWQYADWGIDYLKYDWCSYGRLADTNLSYQQRLMKPYKVMQAALEKQNRDIVFSLCQYGMGSVWQWGALVGGNCWRTTSDISDSWASMSSIGFKQFGHEKWAGPGHWNDPDMLVLGKVGWGHLHPTHLTPNEQYTHISLWCLLASPLLIGADMSQLDAFTLNLLANDEVLAVDQDELGCQASRIAVSGDTEIWAKDLADGSKAVGLFNRGEAPAEVTVKWASLGLKGKCHVRDLWRQKDVGKYAESFAANVPRHGVCLIKVWR
jgi:alpha-galactosidase